MRELLTTIVFYVLLLGGLVYAIAYLPAKLANQFNQTLEQASKPRKVTL